MKTILFLSQVTSHRFFGEGSVAMEMAFPCNPQAAQVWRHFSSGSLFWLDPLGQGGVVSGSATEDRLPKKITQKLSHWARRLPLLEVSRPQLLYIKDNS